MSREYSGSQEPEYLCCSDQNQHSSTQHQLSNSLSFSYARLNEASLTSSLKRNICVRKIYISDSANWIAKR